MKSMSTTAIILSLGVLVSCGGPKSLSSSKTVSIGAILSSDASSNDKAEQLALAAEQLMTPSGIFYADMILDEALKLDPANKRAGIYKAFLAPSFAAKGILARIKPLAEKDPKTKKKLEETIAKIKDSTFKKFLLDGKGDISNEKDVQAFVDSVINSMGKLRQFAKDNKNLDIKLNVNDYLTRPMEYEYHYTYCSTTQSNTYDYTENCSEHKYSSKNKTPSSFALNRGDFEALQHITAGYQIYGSLLNSYSAAGAINVAKNAQGRSKPIQQVWKELIRDADFGKLRNDVFTKIPELGSDAIIGVRWAMTVQNQLCPQGDEQSGSRPGMLFGNGLCVSQAQDSVERALQIAELALQGGRVPVRMGINDTEIAPKALLDNPVQDLKALKPVFSKCGKIAAISDDTLNGLFPHGDLNDTLMENADCPDEI